MTIYVKLLIMLQLVVALGIELYIAHEQVVMQLLLLFNTTEREVWTHYQYCLHTSQYLFFNQAPICIDILTILLRGHP